MIQKSNNFSKIMNNKIKNNNYKTKVKKEF